MSSIGTGVAAGVAGSTQTADQIRKQRDKRQAENTDRTDKLRDTVEAQLRGLEDQDEASEDGGGVRIDPQLNPPIHPPTQEHDDDHPHIDVQG